MTTLREKVKSDIEKAKKTSTTWYMWFNNFGLDTAGCPTRAQFTSSINRHTSGGSNLYQSKTYRLFHEDVDNAFRKAGKFEEMIEKSKLLTEAHKSRDPIKIAKAEEQVAETYIEPYIILREMGYEPQDLGNG